MVGSSADRASSHAEKRLLRDLLEYLKGLMTMQDVTSNMVYVLVLNDHELGWSDLNFMQIATERAMYFHPVGPGRGRWPRTPPNYLGFRFWGKLQEIRHVESYEITTRPHEHIAEIHKDVDWSDEPHFIYRLGPAIKPTRDVRTGNLWMNARVWCALDLLLTCETIKEARDKTQHRLAAVGAQEQ